MCFGLVYFGLVWFIGSASFPSGDYYTLHLQVALHTNVPTYLMSVSVGSWRSCIYGARFPPLFSDSGRR